MSVILTACRHSKQRSIEKALKERAKKQKEKREQQAKLNGDGTYLEDLNPITNPVQIPEAERYMREYESEADGEPATKIWTFLLDEEPFSIVFYKDTLDVYCNGEETDSMNNFPEDDTSDVTVDFCVGAHKARISLQSAGCSNATVNQLLTIDGIPVPE